MRHHRDAVLSALAGFFVTCAVMAPPILAAQAERAAHRASHEAAIGAQAVPFGSDRQARLIYLIRHADKADFDPLGEHRKS